MATEKDMEDDLERNISTTQADVVVDFTHPSVVMQNVEKILNAGAHAVVGTTGLSSEQLKDLDNLASKQKRSVIVCPNFAIGAVLMMTFA